MIQACWLCCPTVPSTCYSVPRACHHTSKWNSGYWLCSPAGTRRLPTPKSMKTTVSESKSPCYPVKEQEHQIPHWGEESYNLLICRQHQKPWSPKVHRSPVLHAAPHCISHIAPSKRWNPSSSTKWQSATVLVLWGLPITVHRDTTLPTVTAEEPLHLHQRAETQAPLLRREKR
jgi:hypothetical protein